MEIFFFFKERDHSKELLEISEISMPPIDQIYVNVIKIIIKKIYYYFQVNWNKRVLFGKWQNLEANRTVLHNHIQWKVKQLKVAERKPYLKMLAHLSRYSEVMLHAKWHWKIAKVWWWKEYLNPSIFVENWSIAKELF